MLNAIAIYDNSKHTRLKSVGKNKLTSFEPSSLSYLEKKLLPGMQYAIKDSATLIDTNEKLYYYVGKRPDDSFLIAICSERKLTTAEVSHLFINIRHAHLRPKVVNLDEIFFNPLGYTGKDKYIDKTQGDIDEVKEIMLKNIDNALLRQNKLEELSRQSMQLQDLSLKFKKSAAELNKPCCWLM